MKKFILFFVIVLLVGCSEDKAPETADVQSQTETAGLAESADLPLEGVELMPLKIGNKWVYEIIKLDTLTMKMKLLMIDTFTVDRDTVIEEQTYYNIDGMGRYGTLATNRDDGFWLMGPNNEPFLMALFPAEPGKEFSHITGVGEITNKLEATGVEITTAAGSFFCYKYVQTFGPRKRTTYNYFAPGVGLVKMETLGGPQGPPVMVSELTAIDIK